MRTYTVELDAFSGRPNPTWTIIGAETADINERLKQLRAVTTMQEPSHLGYRGFMVTSADDPGLSLHVFESVVCRTRADRPTECFSDNRGLEQILKAQATARGHGAAVR
jgi:hypothetical protein